MDITHALQADNNVIIVQVTDSPDDLEMPRGKQYWKDNSEGIFYTRSTGIWQTVWLEAVDKVHLEKVFITPDLDNMQVEFNYEISGQSQAVLKTEIHFEGKLITASTIETERNAGSFKLYIDQQQLQMGITLKILN